jgi:hypothetical protein
MIPATINSHDFSSDMRDMDSSPALCFVSVIGTVSAQNSSFLDPNVDPATEPLNVSACQKFSLRSSSFFPVSSAPSSVVSADFNNDGIPDIAGPMPNTNSIFVALGNSKNTTARGGGFVFLP